MNLIEYIKSFTDTKRDIQRYFSMYGKKNI